MTLDQATNLLTEALDAVEARRGPLEVAMAEAAAMPAEKQEEVKMIKVRRRTELRIWRAC